MAFLSTAAAGAVVFLDALGGMLTISDGDQGGWMSKEGEETEGGIADQRKLSFLFPHGLPDEMEKKTKRPKRKGPNTQNAHG